MNLTGNALLLSQEPQVRHKAVSCVLSINFHQELILVVSSNYLLPEAN